MKVEHTDPETISRVGREHVAMFDVPVVEGNQNFGYRFVKRGIDLAAGLIGGLVLLIPMLIIAAIIRLDSPGGALFRQERLGKCGKHF